MRCVRHWAQSTSRVSLSRKRADTAGKKATPKSIAVRNTKPTSCPRSGSRWSSPPITRTASSRRSSMPRTPVRSATARSSSSMSNAPCASAPANRTMTLFEGVQLMLCRISKVSALAGLVALVAAAPALAQGAAAAAPFTPTADMVNKGDTAWMLTSSALVLMMSVPALALFYGGLVRAKNMLSVLMQVLAIVCITTLMWVGWGYSMAFTSGNEFVGGLSKAFLKGVDATTLAATFSNHVYIPEHVYVIFQMTFACITPALIVGGFA